MQAFVPRLFSGIEVQGCYQFRLTRNSDLFVDEEEIDDLRRALEGERLRDYPLFTSDLFLRRGPSPEPVVEGKMSDFSEIAAMSIPSPEGRQACMETIKKLEIRMMALGHGPAVKIT